MHFSNGQQTPLEEQNHRYATGVKAIGVMSKMKNVLCGLSPETREAWRAFNDLVWRDLKLLRSQRDLYMEENSKVEEVRKHNVKQLDEAYRRRASVSVEKTIRTIDDICNKCRNSGLSPNDELRKKYGSANTHPIFCTCKSGVKAYEAYKIEKGVACLQCMDTGVLPDDPNLRKRVMTCGCPKGQEVRSAKRK